MNCCDTKQHKEQNNHQTPTGLKGWLSGPRSRWLAAALVVGMGLVLGWEHLVVLGLAPLLISLLPCLVMCALGLCMMRFQKKPTNNDHKVASGTTEPAVRGIE